LNLFIFKIPLLKRDFFIGQGEEHPFGFCCVALLYFLVAIQQQSLILSPSPLGEGGQAIEYYLAEARTNQKNNAIRHCATILLTFNLTIITKTRACHSDVGGIFELQLNA
jgi:hypothetical protein